MSDSTTSQLETLPNELFLEIFSYMAPRDLCSFKGLNRRIDSILSDVKLSLSPRDESRIEQLLSTFSPLQVIHFKTNVRFCELAYTMKDLRSLTLHSLLLKTDSELDGVRQRISFRSNSMRFSAFS